MVLSLGRTVPNEKNYRLQDGGARFPRKRSYIFQTRGNVLFSKMGTTGSDAGKVPNARKQGLQAWRRKVPRKREYSLPTVGNQKFCQIGTKGSEAGSTGSKRKEPEVTIMAEGLR